MVGRSGSMAWLVLACLCWGGGFVSTKAVLGSAPPFSVFAIQLTGSVLFLGTFAALSGATLPRGRAAIRIALVGGLEPGLAYLLTVCGFARTSGVDASVLSTLESAIVVVGSWLLGERAGWRRLVLAGVAFAGAVLLGVADASGNGSGDLPGDMLVLGGAAAAGVYVLVTTRTVPRASPLAMALVQQLAAWAIALVAVAVARGLGAEPQWRADFRQIVAIAASGVLLYGLAFWFYLRSSGRLSSTTTATLLTLVPVFGVGGSLLFLHETLSLLEAAGAAIVLAATGLAARQAEPVAALAAP